jgi:hypothetical protein
MRARSLRGFVVFGLVGAACVAAAVACTQAASEGPSADGDSWEAKSDAANADVAEAGRDAGSESDAASDATASDASVGDAQRLFEANCGASGNFCWNFDQPPYNVNPQGPPWMGYYDGETGYFGLVDAGFSAPNASRLFVTDGGFSVMYVDLVAGTTSAACGARVKIVTADVKAGSILTMGTGQTQGALHAKLATPSSLTADVELDNGRGENTALGSVPIGQWFEVQIGFSSGAYSGYIRSGASATSATADAGDPEPPNSAGWQLGTTGGWEILYDDLACAYH